MPQPPAGQDYYMVIGLDNTGLGDAGVMGAVQVFVATGSSEEEAVAKVAKVVPHAVLFTAQVTPTFSPPEGT
jgi:hypothetical protein